MRKSNFCVHGVADRNPIFVSHEVLLQLLFIAPFDPSWIFLKLFQTKKTGKQRDEQTDEQTDGQMDKQTEEQTNDQQDKQTAKQTAKQKDEQSD